jgi:hypothetical protein
MSRFAGWSAPPGGIPQSVSLFPDWELLRRERATTDVSIIDWADNSRARGT